MAYYHQEEDAYKTCESLVSALSKAQGDLVRCRTQIYNLEAVLIRTDDNDLCSYEPASNSSKVIGKQSSEHMQLLKSTLSHMNKDKRLFMDKLKSVLNAQIMLQDQVKKLQVQVMPQKGDGAMQKDAVRRGNALIGKVSALQSHMSTLEKHLSQLVTRDNCAATRNLRPMDRKEVGSNNNNSEMHPLSVASSVSTNYMNLTKQIQKLRSAAEFVLRGEPKPAKQYTDRTRLLFDVRPGPSYYAQPFRHAGSGDGTPWWPITRRSYRSVSPAMRRPERHSEGRGILHKPKPRCAEHGKSPVRADASSRGVKGRRKEVVGRTDTREAATQSSDALIDTGTQSDDVGLERSIVRLAVDDTPPVQPPPEKEIVTANQGVQATIEDLRSRADFVCSKCESRKHNKGTEALPPVETTNKGTRTAPPKTRTSAIQTASLVMPRRAVACQSEPEPVRSPTPTVEPAPPVLTAEKSSQADSPIRHRRSWPVQTEDVPTTTIGAQFEGPGTRTNGVQVDPPSPPPPPPVRARGAQTESPPPPETRHSPPSRSRAPRHSPHSSCRRCPDHHHRCKSPIAYYRAHRDCRCLSPPSSPSRLVDDECQ